MKSFVIPEQHAAIRDRSNWRFEEIAFWAAAVVSYFLFPTSLVLITQILISGLFALSLDLLLGYSGIPSFGHAAFFGLGAYTAGLFGNHGWGEPVSGLLVAGLAAGFVGLVCGMLVARMSGIGLLMVTMCLGLLAFEGASRLSWITGGDTGLQGIEMWPLLGLFEFDIFGRTAFWYTISVCFGLYLFARRFIGSPEGLALEGIRENSVRVAALGISTRRSKVLAFTVSAAMAGIAGGLLAQTTQIVALESLSFERSVAALIMLIVGGVGSLIGGFLGAAVFLYTRDLLSSLSPVYWMFWLGLILMTIVLVGRGGLVGAIRLAVAYFRNAFRGNNG
jgi:branched-chain amino acid transport system permease protein